MDINSQKSFWDSKPYWCQPWSIISFGFITLITVWKVFSNLIITSFASLIIFAWWIVFLILAPNSYQIENDKE